MTYWNETSDSHLRFWTSESYISYQKIASEMNEQGYRGDLLCPSEVVFLGTCDVMTNLMDTRNRWAKKIHTTLHPEQPFIALGSVGSGVPTMVRRLYSYIQNFGAPKQVYMTVPRFDGREYVNKSGKCYNVSTRVASANFCHKSGLIDDEEVDIWLQQLAANKRITLNGEDTRYLLEERFAFIETLCKAHNIQLKWTFNPSDAAIVVLQKNLSAVKDISDFMKSSFVGLAQVKDHVYDRSIGPHTHEEIFQRFMNPEKWDFDVLCERAEANLNWLVEKYKDQEGGLIKGQD